MPVHYKVVEGVRLPAKLSGHPALDFCNTLTGWDGEAPRDYLQSYEHLAVWARFAELVPLERTATLRRQAQRQGTAAAATLERARDLRARLYDVLRGGASEQAFDDVAEDVEAAAGLLRLRRGDRGNRWAVDPAAGLGAPVAAVAWSAGQLLTSAELSLVRACPGHGCGWLFLDHRGRRRWCTMATCGNRAKVKAFAIRHRATAVLEDAPERGAAAGELALEPPRQVHPLGALGSTGWARGRPYPGVAWIVEQ